MKDVTFTSNVNGLQVSAPADAFPSPNCGKLMCPDRPEPAGFACPAALGAPVFNQTYTQRFSFIAVEAGWGPVGFSLDDFGEAPDGVPANWSTQLELITEEEGNYVGLSGYGGIKSTPAPMLTLYDATGAVIWNTTVPNVGGASFEASPVGAALVAGETYCVALQVVGAGNS